MFNIIPKAVVAEGPALVGRLPDLVERRLLYHPMKVP